MPTALLIFPGLDEAEQLRSRLTERRPDLHLHHAADGAQAEGLLGSLSSVDLLLCEVCLEDANGIELMGRLRGRFPAAAPIVVTRYDLSGFRDQLGEMPVVLFPDEIDRLAGLIEGMLPAAAAADDESFWSPYRLVRPLGTDRWGECHEAIDENVRRIVYLTAEAEGADAAARETFRAEASLMARATHPNVTAVYQSGHKGDRAFFTREFWQAPSLADLAEEGKQLEPKKIAQVLLVAARVLESWERRGMRHLPFSADRVTIGERRVVKIVNCVTALPVQTETVVQSLAALAPTLRRLYRPQPGTERLDALIERLDRRDPALSPEEILGEAGRCEIELAGRGSKGSRSGGSRRKKEGRRGFLWIALGFVVLLGAIGGAFRYLWLRGWF